MKRVIVGFQLDHEQHWVARLVCGHLQHVRDIPPWQNRPWVKTYKGRSSMLGQHLLCTKCLDLAPRDWN